MTAIYRYITFFVLGIIAVSSVKAAPAGNITVKASVDSVELIMGDRANLSVQVDMPAGEESTVQLVDFPLLTPGTEYIDFHGVDVVKSDSTVVSANGRTRINFDFVIQAFDPGTITIPPFAVVSSQGRDTVYSGIVALKVIPVDVDSLETINPMESIVSPRTRWYDYFPDWLLWTLLGIVVACLGVWAYLKLRKHQEIVEERRQAPVPPYELAMTRLNTLRSRNLAESGQEKEYYTELVDILRQYLEGRFGINAMEMTSTQIVRALRSNPETRLTAEEMKSVLSIADFVKFAKVRPLPDDNIRAFSRAINFVETTKPAPEPEPEEEQNTQNSQEKNKK